MKFVSSENKNQQDKFKLQLWLLVFILHQYSQEMYKLHQLLPAFSQIIRFFDEGLITSMHTFLNRFGLVWFYVISTTVGYLMPNLLNTYILNIHNLVWFGDNHCCLFYAKSSLYIYIRYIWFGLVGFYGISTIVGYLMPNPLYTYILNMI